MWLPARLILRHEQAEERVGEIGPDRFQRG